MQKGKFFSVVAFLVIVLGATPGMLLTQLVHPPRREADVMDTGRALLWSIGAFLVGGLLLILAHRAPADQPFLGETRRSWLGLLYMCLIAGFGVGIAFAIYLH